MPWSDWSDRLTAAPMDRVAIVTPAATLRDALVALATRGRFEPDERHRAAVETDNGAPDEARSHLARRPADTPAPAPVLSSSAPDLDALERAGRWDLLAGEAELARLQRGAVQHGRAAMLVGWAPHNEVPHIRADLEPLGADVAPLPRPRGLAPTLEREAGVGRAFDPLVRTYATVPYRDVDPSLFAGITYVAMFGMMFGDIGHGLILAAIALAVRWRRPRRLGALADLWALALGAGLASAAFGALYGEAFGPTGLRPLWLAPLDEPLRLLASALAVGAVLLAVTYVIGAVNRWREGGARTALYSPAGIAGALVFVGVGGLVAGFTWWAPLRVIGGTVAGLGIVLTFVGLLVEAGVSVTGVLQAAVELFDSVLRIGSNAVSFTRLAAFGMTHAAISQIVWEATTALWAPGPGALGAIVVFIAGQTVAFSLELLVVAIQALRLEYYELFSRVFTGEGRPFAPFQLAVEPWKEPA